MKPRSTRRRAFTLIELLTVIAIVAVLAAITIIGIGTVSSSARKARLASNLRVAHTGLMAYVADNKNMFPGSSGNDVTGLNVSTDSSWHAVVARHVGEAPLSMTHWRANGTIEKSVFHDPMDTTVTASGRPTRNIAINGINGVGATAMGVVNRNLNTIANPARLMALTTGIPAEAGDEYAGGMRVAQAYYSDATRRAQFTRVAGNYYCVFVDGHVEIVSEARVREEVTKSAYSVFFDPAATNGTGR